MASKNILLIAPKAIVGDIVNAADLPCKVLVIHDGFKAMVGLLKLFSSQRPLDGIYVHSATSRVELPSYIEAIRALEKGLERQPLPIWLASEDMQVSSTDVVCVNLPYGTDEAENLTVLTQQLNEMVGGVRT